MRIPVVLLAAAIALGVASCGGTNPPPGTSDNSIKPMDEGTGTASANPGQSLQPGGGANVTTIDGQAPPKDAQFTLFCDAIRGPNHVLTATKLKERLMGEPGLHSWHIVHSNDQSAIFYGYYRTFDDRQNDPQEAARAQADMKQIEALKNLQGDRLFAHAIFLPINNPDPDAPPQWNLTRTPVTAYWSLQIGAYEGSPDRKKFAVEAVREMRSQGIEAYYYHGETISSVCVGAWPKEAVKDQESAAATTADPNATLMVLGGPIGPIDTSNMRDRDGNKVTVEAPKLEILDGTMAKAIRDYPEHAVNGEVLVKTARNGQKIPSPSFLVLIPHNEGPPAPMIPLPSPKITINNGADQAANDILDDSKPAEPGRGQLRSLDHP